MSNEPEAVRMWREINANREMTAEHTTRIHLIEAKVDGLSRELSSNLCQVCNKLDELSSKTDTLSSSVRIMQVHRERDEKQNAHVFDRWLPLALGVIAAAMGIAKFFAA